MQQSWVTAVAILGVMACAPDARAQVAPCDDLELRERCAPEEQQRVRDLFDVPPIESHHEAEDVVRRAFYVDGYDRDIVAISFIRTRGREPFVSVHAPRLEGRPPQPPLVASVPEDVWSDVLRRSAIFDRGVIPKPTEPGYAWICLHPWVWTVEGTDPPPDSGPRRSLRRRVESSCAEGATGQFADELARTALSVLSHCRSLDLDDYRNEALLLAECFKLSGDRNAAARVRNLVEEFQYLSTFGNPLALGMILTGALELDGKRLDTDDPEIDWIDRVWGSWPSVATLSVETVDAESARRATVVGSVSRSRRIDPAERNGRWLRERARVEMIWVGQYDSFVIDRISIGAFEAEPADPD